MSHKKIYWRGPEELDKNPDFLKQSEKEFPEELPVDKFLANDALQLGSTTRRDFLKFVGFSLTAATLAACESPVIKTIPYVNKPEDITPGVANWYATTYFDGHDFASILVKSREGRPIYIKPLPNGCTQGGATPRVLASLLPLYNAARLKTPYASGNKTSWDSVDAAVVKDLQDVAAKGGNIRILSSTVNSPSSGSAIEFFMKGALGGLKNDGPLLNDTTFTPAPALVSDPASTSDAKVKHVQYDAISYFAIRQAHKNAFGKDIIPDHNFEKAKVIVSVGADFLANWLLPAQFVTQYAVNRKADNEWMSHHFQYESIMSVTGSNADVRVQIKPSEEGAVITALYQHITGNNLGASEAMLQKTAAAANELKANKGASLVVAAANDINIQTLVAGINHQLGNYGTTLNLTQTIELHRGNDTEVENLLKEMEAGKVDALIIAGNANPAYTLPASAKFNELIKKVGVTVSFSGYMDETASLCKYVCPSHHYLEAWNDYNPKTNCYCMAQPLIRPMYDTRDWQESLLVWCGMAKRGDKDSATFYNLIRSNWKHYGYDSMNLSTAFPTFDEYWNWQVHNSCSSVETPSDALAENTETATSTVAPGETTQEPVISFAADAAAAAKALAGVQSGQWEIVFYSKASMGDGQQANNPWLQEMPDPITRVTWDNYVTMSMVDIKRLGLNSYIRQEAPASVVKVSINGSDMELPVFPSPGQTPGTVGIALGYGRGANGENLGRSAFHVDEWGAYLTDETSKKTTIGKNVFACTSFQNGLLTYNALSANITSTGSEYPLACTQVHHTIMGRDSVLRETTWNVYKQGEKEDYNPEHTVNYYGKEKSVKEIDLWKAHPIEHVGHRWGMTIDLNACTGCGNCIIACHAENNVPVVGKDEVRRGRDMHWIRIDRYFSSEMNMEKGVEQGLGTIATYGEMEVPSDNPEVVFMPMMCHHCNHAPCETVCPVLATTHSKEGLNQMTYNRCIGTRYCANNCPYKVRRFNWFNYEDYKKFQHVNPAADDMSRLVLNPDVTVRSRGVMEKCSMCVQRIQEGKLVAKKEGRKLVDGDINLACAEVCPARAITFGDWNDTESQVRKESAENRSYQALEEVGIRPNLWYKVKVRNKHGEMPAKKHGHAEKEKHE